MQRLYPAIIWKDPRGKTYGLTFPDLPGCTTSAASMEALYEAAQEAGSLWIEAEQKTGRAPPPATALEAVRLGKSDRAEGAVGVIVVPVTLPSRAVRISMTIEERLLGEIDRAAADRGTTRSGFLAEAARNLMRRAS
jgi:predicted RNase H-like HicB family nuclease